MNTLQILAQKMQTKGYTSVSATLRERDWLDTPEVTYTVTATLQAGTVTVTVNGTTQSPEEAARWVLKVVNSVDANGNRVQFHPVTTSGIDLGETRLTREDARKLHVALGNVAKGTKFRPDHYELASMALGRQVHSFTEITLGEAERVIKTMEAHFLIWKQAGGEFFGPMLVVA